jgi:hypothetical protein
MSPNLQYHLNENLCIAESIFRPGSTAHISLLTEARFHFENGVTLDPITEELFIQTDLGFIGEYLGEPVPLDFPIEEVEEIIESEYKGRKVKLNYPQRGGDKKKYYVYVKNPKTGRVMKISFGDIKGGLTAKVSNPKARASFAARHQCHLKKDKTKAGYWACRINRYAHLWGGKTYPGFW